VPRFAAIPAATALLGAALAVAGCNAAKDKDAGAAASADDGAAKLASLSLVDQTWPATLAETGLFAPASPGAAPAPIAAFVAYDVAVPLWSDGARKSRYVYVPKGGVITYDDELGMLILPPGALLIKHFAVDDELGTPIETRVIARKTDGELAYATYVWDDAGNATLNERPHKVTRAGAEFRIPSEKECKTCHTGSALGFVTHQLDMPTADGGNQLEMLSTKLSFNVGLDMLLAHPLHLTPPGDATQPVAARARTYVGVNCSPCHNPAGPEKANLLDFRLVATETNAVAAGKVVPRDPDTSILWQKISGTTERMPPVSLRADPVALDVLRQWITEWPAP
jgi:hypothetical protein